MALKYCPPALAEEQMLEAYSLLVASNESYEIDPFDPDFTTP